MTAPLFKEIKMTTTHRPQTAEAVVVGVTERIESKAAIDFAASDAMDRGRPLVLVSAVDAGRPAFGVLPEGNTRPWEWLEDLRGRVAADFPDLRIEIDARLGPVASVLLRCTEGQSELVVGRRDLTTIGRIVIGSHSTRLAARASVPVVVVPDEWDVGAHKTDPIVTGVDPDNVNVGLLEYAFKRAADAGVVLRVVHARDLSPVMGMTPADAAAKYEEWRAHSVADLRKILRPFREQFVSVDVETIHDRGYAPSAILSHATDAQLVVVGRRSARAGMFGLGSVAREVLHSSSFPVAIVPR